MLTRVGPVAVVAAAAAIVTVLVLGAGAVGARRAAPAGPEAAPVTMVATTTTAATTTTTASTTTTTLPPTTTTRPSTTTTTAIPARPRQSLAACLALAAANHYQVVAANEIWFRNQLHALAVRHRLAGPQANALRIEEGQAQTEIAAQYAIDRSNCYLA